MLSIQFQQVEVHDAVLTNAVQVRSARRLKRPVRVDKPTARRDTFCLIFGSQEFLRKSSTPRHSCPKFSSMPTCTVKRLFRIQNPHLHERYETKKKELEDRNKDNMMQPGKDLQPQRESYLGVGLEHRLRPIVNELRLFHGTTENCARLTNPLHAHRTARPCDSLKESSSLTPLFRMQDNMPRGI